MNDKNNRYNKTEQRYKYEVEKDDEYEYIRSYRKGDILPNGRVTGDAPYIQIKHKYCVSVYEIKSNNFIILKQRCGKCCHIYENSFAYHIEVELNESLDKYWDFEKNKVNPYHISKCSDKRTIGCVWIKCQEKDYHGSYEISCDNFTGKGRRCNYCSGTNKVRKLDSFGTKYPDKAKCWHEDNDKSPFEVKPGTNKKFKFKCDKCSNVWESNLNSVSQGKWCPKCNSSKGEKRVERWLMENNVIYESQKTYSNLLGLGCGLLSYDFYLPDYNLLIEYQGEFHDGNLVDRKHQTTEQLNYQQEHDKRKKQYSIDNNIKLLEIWYWDYNNIENILSKEL